MKILYVSRAGLPTDAAGMRIFNVGEVLEKAGHEVEFLSDLEVPNINKNPCYYKGFKYQFKIKKRKRKKYVDSIINILDLIFAISLFKRVKNYCELEKPSHIILYNDLFFLTKKLIKYCNQNNIKLIADSTEWYEKRKSFKIQDKIIPYLTDKRIRYLDENCDGILAISPFLVDFYRKKSVKVFFLPPIFNFDNKEEKVSAKRSNNSSMRLVYAGAPKNKEFFSPIIKAVEIANFKSKKNIELNIIGISEQEIKKIAQKAKVNMNHVYAHGRLPHKKTLEIIRKADFSIMLRHNKRYAKAGFSTKFAESMCQGIPVITNKVGGGDLFITNFKNGIITNNDAMVIARLLVNLSLLEEEKLNEIKAESFLTAKNLFNQSRYINPLDNFLSNL